MSAPRVLVLTHSLSGVDGVGRYGAGMLRGLSPLCGEIEVFIGRGHRGFSEDLPREAITLYENLATDHFPFLNLPKLGWLLANNLPGLVRAARRADVVHSFADYPMGFVAVLTARLAGRPVVVSGHGTYSVAPLEMPVHRRLIGWMYARADRFLMGADHALGRLLAVTTPARAEVVPYGCVPSDYDEGATRGEQPGVPGPYVLCVGEVKQRKGYAISVPAFLGAWRACPEAHFVIVGRHAPEDPYYLELLRLIDEAGARDHVHFLGNVSEAHKVALMRGARAFMLTPVTSDEGGFEAFGLVFLEAGAAGTPVVGVSGSGAEDAITDGSNGFLRAPDDVPGLSEGLTRLLEDEELARTMGRAGRRRAEGQTWQTAAWRVRQIYGELLGGDFVFTPPEVGHPDASVEAGVGAAARAPGHPGGAPP